MAEKKSAAYRIQTSVSAETYKALEMQAKALEMTVSAYARYLIVMSSKSVDELVNNNPSALMSFGARTSQGDVIDE